MFTWRYLVTALTTALYIMLDPYRHSCTFRKNLNRFRSEDHAFTLLGVGRSR